MKPAVPAISFQYARLTQRAADLGYAPRYFDICLALSFSRFGGESTLPPQAANANRWTLNCDYVVVVPDQSSHLVVRTQKHLD